MKINLLAVLMIIFISITSEEAHSQENNFEQLTLQPRKVVNFPLDYKITRPRLEYPNWDHDFDQFYAYHTPILKKTQASLSFTDKGVVTTITPNSIIPHAQLDTGTIINRKEEFVGTWRMLAFRSIFFNDSVNIPTKTYYRLPDKLLDDKSNDEVFAVLTDNNFKLFAREIGKDDFKRVMSSKYKIENRRYILLYKFSKAGAGVSQIGIDENGYLILNYPKVIENVMKGEYYSYYAIIDQYIFERVK